MAKELSILIGGSQGQGIQSMGQVISRSLSRVGLHVFAIQDFESRIRGGHTFFQLRTAGRRVDAHVDEVDVVVALNEETIQIHEHELAPHGIIIYDSDKIKTDYSGDKFFPLSMTGTAREEVSNTAMANTVALGALWAMMGLDIAVLEDVLDSFFGRKSREIVEKNVKVARIGYERGEKYSKREFNIDKPEKPARRYVISGTEAVGMASIASDLHFYSAYPMTPATGVMEFIMAHSKDYQVVVEQAEDEIAALNMAIATSYMGIRSMAGTSGGGFSLMVEALGLAGCIEAPVVIYEAQRAGPATGMPTRHEQSDLLFCIFASQGEFPRVVFAPITPESAFELTVEAFNWADRLQTPVFVLSDHHLADSYWTVDSLPLDGVTVDRGKLASGDELDSGSDYLRYRLTEDGISPRAWPGQGTALVCATGDEHDESGHITEEPELRTAMVDKRMNKLKALDESPGLVSDIQEGADTVLVGWGSSYGALRETVDLRRERGEKISLIQVYRVWPFPAGEFDKALDGHSRMVVVENNATGQLARLIRMETGQVVADQILKYDGRPFSVEDIDGSL